MNTMRSAACVCLCLCLCLCPCLPQARASGASAPGLDALRAEGLGGRTLCLRWDAPDAAPGEYTVTLCQEDSQRCWLAGQTLACVFLLISLEPGLRYTVRVSAEDGAEAELTVALPGEEPTAATQGQEGADDLQSGDDPSAVSHLSVQPLDACTAAVFWDETGRGAYRYTLTLCQAEDASCRLLGSTNEKAFALDGLLPGASYTVHIGAPGGNTVSTDFTMPAAADD